MFIEGNKAIQLYCYKSTKSPPDYELTLTYIDKDLEKIAINEGQEIERKKILEESSDYDL